MAQDLSGYYTSKHTAETAGEAAQFPIDRVLTGRKMIYTDYLEINRGNVLEVLQKALSIHSKNSNDIDYLYEYYKGDQPILYRKKEIRPEINNHIVENRANQIVSFKVGYLMGEPIQYVAHCEDDKIAEDLNTLNEFMFSEDKSTKDKELAEWNHICGTAYRLVTTGDRNDESPFHIYTLDPRSTFVVYGSTYECKPVMAVTYVKKQDNTIVYSIYTKNKYFEITNDVIVDERNHKLGEIPIIEYPLNNARLGAFEIVLPLLDAMNLTASDRQNGLEGFVQSLMRFHNVDITAEDFSALRALGAIKYKDIDAGMKAEVDYLNSELNQTQTETLVKHQYQTILEIVGIPSQSDGNTSDSSNNGAVILKNGWQMAESRAKDSELTFKLSEKQFLKIALRICEEIPKTKVNLRLGNIEIRFTRRNYENILQKAQVFQLLINQDKLSPEYAFTQSGLFVDPNRAYTESMAYYESEVKQNGSEDNTRDNATMRDDIE